MPIFILTMVKARTHCGSPRGSGFVIVGLTCSELKPASAIVRVEIDADRWARGRSAALYPFLTTTRSFIPSISMSVNPTFESTEPKKPFPVEVVGGIPPPTYDAIDAEAAIPQPTESQPVSRVKTFFLTILYTVAFAITTTVFCLYGSLSIGFLYDERAAAFARVTYASALGSVILGPIYFTNQRFTTFMKTRNDVVSIHMANGRLLKAVGYTVLVCAIVTGVAVFTATLGYGLIFWPLLYSDDLTTKKMVINAVLTPVACLLGGFRWTREVISITMWMLVRVPKISTGLEGEKYDKLIKIAYVLLFVSRFPF